MDLYLIYCVKITYSQSPKSSVYASSKPRLFIWHYFPIDGSFQYMRRGDNSSIGETLLQGNGSRAAKWKNWCQGTLFFQGWKILAKGNLIWNLNIPLSKVWSSFAKGEHENMRVQEMRSLWISYITAGLQSEIALQKSSVNWIYIEANVMWICYGILVLGTTWSFTINFVSWYKLYQSQPKNTCWTQHVMFSCSHSFSLIFFIPFWCF